VLDDNKIFMNAYASCSTAMYSSFLNLYEMVIIIG
jgi:hypothetical protein